MRAAILIFVLTLLSGCVDTPVTSTTVVDDRPRVAFDISALTAKASAYELVIDNVSYGPVSQYLKDEATLRVVSGNHLIEIKLNGQRIFSQQVYLGENSTRVIKVASYE